MNESIGNRIRRGASGGDTRHVIDSALFGLSFGSGSPYWPDELELARIVQTELMQVVEEVFDERSQGGAAIRIEKLEVDLGSFVFDGSWSHLRERLREGLHEALLRTRVIPVDEQGDESGGVGTSTGFDLLAHFLRFGVLPRHTQMPDRQRMERLLRDTARDEPQRVAALIRADAVGGAVAARLVQQFPDVLVRQIVKALGLGDVPLLRQPSGQSSGPAADARPEAALMADAAGVTGVSPVKSGEDISVRAGADLPSGSELDQLLRALESRQPKSLDGLFERLKSGEIVLADLVGELSTEGYRRLLDGLIAAATTAAGNAVELRRAIALHALRVSSERDFYRRIIERLVQGELIDVEAIAARSALPDRQDKARQRNNEQLDAAGSATGPPSGSKRLFRGYDLYTALVAPDEADVAEQVRTEGAVDELAREHPQQFQRLLSELRSGVLELEPIAARLSEVDLRRLCEAFVMMAAGSADTDRRQFLHSLDDHARFAGNERAFRLQVLQRLVDGAPVDLEALASNAVLLAIRQEVPAGYPEPSVQPEPPDAALQTQTTDTAAQDDRDSRAALHALGNYLGGGATLTGPGLAQLRRSAERLLGSESRQFAELLRQSLTGEAAIARLLKLLPERLLTRVLYLLAPADHERMQRYADAVVNVCTAAQTGIAPAQLAGLKWRFCLQHLSAAGSQWTADRFVQRFAEFLAAHSVAGLQDSNAVPPPVSDANRFARFLRQSLQGEEEIVRLAEAERPGGERQAKDDTEFRALLEHGIHIANAGQVLAAPYLPRLFAMLGLVEDGRFKRPELRARAVHLLQFMVDESSDTPEYELALNKILCGLERVGTVNRGVLVSDAEREAIEGLLRGMIQNWQVLKRTSVNGFRESFLQREGRLRLDHDGWHLAVEPKPFDMLLDRIPWSFSIVKLPWMKEVVYVDWR